MTATLIPARTEADWLAARRTGVTASEIATVMGVAPGTHNSPFALYYRKTGELPDVEDNDAMERGRILEPYIAAKFAQRHQEVAVTGDGRSLWAHPKRPWQMATPDRFAYESLSAPRTAEPVAVIECKSDASVGEQWGDDGTDEIPVHYRCQLLWQMDVTGVPTGYLACLFIQPWKTRIYELGLGPAERHDLDIMRLEAQLFLDRIEERRPPEPDWRPATRDALNRLHPEVEDVDVPVGRQLEISYRAAVRRYKEAERRKDEMTNRVLDVIGNGHRATGRGGATVATRSVGAQRRVSATLVRERHPAVAAECTVTTAVAKLTPAKPKKEKTP